LTHPAREEKDQTSDFSSTAVQEKHPHIKGRGIVSNFALGLSDGVITNLAFLAGFSGALVDLGIIRLAGIASMFAGAVSMFFGGLMAGRTERDLFRADSAREAYEIENEPEEEKQELEHFYLDKGLSKEESDLVVKRIASDRKKWLNDMLMHELSINEARLESPLKVALVVGLSFLLGAFVPLIPYLIFSTKLLSIFFSAGVSLIFLFVTGGWKGKLSGRRLWKAGIEMLLVGAAAAAILYLIGRLIIFV
jgi:vacuolar iron transporter family protein